MIAKSRVPQIRFKGFSGEWEDKILDKISSSIFDGTHQTPTYTDSGIPFFSVENLISKSKNKYISNKDYIEATQKNKPEKNDILITRIGNIGFSKVVIWDYDFSIYVTLAVVKQSKMFNSFYLNYYIQSSKYQAELVRKSLLSAVPCKINMNELRSTNIFLPKSITEQTKIGNYFQNLDKLIEQKEKRQQKLKQFKKAMLDKMFPKNGANTPEIRFKGFSGEWEEKEINELFTVTRGNVLATTEISNKKSEEMPYPVYSSQTKNHGLLGFYKKYLFENAITWTTDGANAGTVKYRDGKFYSTNVNGVLLSTEGYANQAIAEILNCIAWKHVSYVGNPKLMNNVMSKIKISVPSSIQEQNYISDILIMQDKLIDLHQKEIKKLKNIKKASLDKMFV